MTMPKLQKPRIVGRAGREVNNFRKRIGEEKQRTRKGRSARVWLARLAIVVTLLAIWQFSSGRFVPEFLVSNPLAVASSFVEMIQDGSLFVNSLYTLQAVFSGFLIGGLAGILVGYFLGVSAFWASAIEPLLSALYTLPRIALIPVLIIAVGIGTPLATTMAAILVFFLLFYNTYYGIREVDQALIDSIRIMGGNRLNVAASVRIPSALVWIVAGMRISIPQAFVGVIAAELLASGHGLGHLVALRAGQFDMRGAFAVLFALLIMGFVLNLLVTVFSRRALIWKGGDEHG